jgi:hypothetical protein
MLAAYILDAHKQKGIEGATPAEVGAWQQFDEQRFERTGASLRSLNQHGTGRESGSSASSLTGRIWFFCNHSTDHRATSDFLLHRHLQVWDTSYFDYPLFLRLCPTCAVPYYILYCKLRGAPRCPSLVPGTFLRSFHEIGSPKKHP